MRGRIRRMTGAIAALSATALFIAMPMAYAASSHVTPATESITPAAISGCYSIGGGKYNCHVYVEAPSRYSDGERAGILHRGWNYFYCQTAGSWEEHYGGYHNYWIGLTDDDSGNVGVYVNMVYVSGGNNDEPVPGLPGC